MGNLDLTPYEIGYDVGFYSKKHKCPYQEGTFDHAEWWKGFYQGEADLKLSYHE